jgi:hypothetical protein
VKDAIQARIVSLTRRRFAYGRFRSCDEWMFGVISGNPFFVHLNQSDSENEDDFAIQVLYGRVLRNFFISSITCASFDR